MLNEEDLNEWDTEAAAALERPKETSPFHVMVDIETFGVGPAAFPIAIGAVKFDSSWDGEILGDESPAWDQFYVAIDPRQGPALGIDIQTVMWWMEKAQREPLDRWLAEPKVSLTEALAGFVEWYGEESLPTWSKGPAFDAVILETAYKVCGLKRPWHFRQDRDCRTIRGLLAADWGAKMTSGVKHNALEDAIRQTHELLAVARELGLTLR